MAGRAQHDGGNRVGRGGGGGQAQQQGHRGRRVHGIGEGQQQRGARDAPDARQDAEAQPHRDPEEEKGSL